MQGKHSKGPWRNDERFNLVGGFPIVDADGVRVAQVYTYSYEPKDANQEHWNAYLKRRLANTNLISAAPELLEAVDRLLDGLAQVGGKRAEDIAFARRAAARARGEALA